MIREAIAKLVDGRSLTEDEAAAVMEEIMTGEATPAQLAAFVVALRLKGETVDEIAGMARVMRAKALRVPFEGPSLLDTCGTGGDAQRHLQRLHRRRLRGGRRRRRRRQARQSRHDQPVRLRRRPRGPGRPHRPVAGAGGPLPARRRASASCSRPAFHPAMRFAAGPRREIGVRTVFNVLGPLTNPAGAQAQVLGVADAALAEKMAQVLERLGCRHALVVHGEDGLDEMTLTGPTLVHELKDGALRSYRVAPEDVGLRPRRAAGR